MKEALILCRANSCRSQMAEGLINHYLKDRWKAYSAGYEPSSVHPKAVQVMAELNIDISSQTSKGIESFSGKDFNLIITVCGEADEKCPMYMGKTPKIHIGFTDPGRMKGTEEVALEMFRAVRDDMRSRLVDFLKYL